MEVFMNVSGPLISASIAPRFILIPRSCKISQASSSFLFLFPTEPLATNSYFGFLHYFDMGMLGTNYYHVFYCNIIPISHWWNPFSAIYKLVFKDRYLSSDWNKLFLTGPTE
jgi:hypothetical protein